ncbi:A disintegrin and metalloproteinase with thrombospondin motifs 9-like isoform X2 [Styela clava]
MYISILATLVFLIVQTKTQKVPWAQWGLWTQCDQPCDYGLQRRYRGCVQTSQAKCTDRQTRLCTTGTLCSHMHPKDMKMPVNIFEPYWLPWQGWSLCTVTCGGGVRNRVRKCAPGSGRTCQKTGSENCNLQTCKSRNRVPTWNSWTPWIECSKTCGSGISTRYRSCKRNGSPSNCVGKSTEVRYCKLMDCELEPKWNAWAPWSKCSKTCGRGISRRDRSCEKKGSRSNCVGSNTKVRRCKLTNCVTESSWNKWESWMECSVTCGRGSQKRIRTCLGNSCMGKRQELKTCNKENCPADPIWNAWESWSQCSVTCDSGVMTRIRLCDRSNSLTNCVGTSTEEIFCELTECKQESWSAWSTWTRCYSAKCGTFGWRVRRRKCNAGTAIPDRCKGKRTDFEKCSKECDSREWSTWENWNKCSVSCGGGIRSRIRSCETPGNCVGPNKDKQECNKESCESDPQWSDWGEWSECSLSCGSGDRVRERTCIGGESSTCEGVSTDSMKCNVQECKSEWSTWGNWVRCSVSCGGGSRSRFRSCETPGKCVGPNNDKQECNKESCKPDPQWSDWGEWSECSLSCGSGDRVRERTCIGGKSNTCEGVSTDSMKCNIRECKSEEWSTWGNWVKCSVSCGGGSRSRFRSCETPGKCVGPNNDKQECNKESCEPDPQWSDWGEWSECSLSCGSGDRVRERTCIGGKSNTCEGVSTDSMKCDIRECKSEWGNWEQWSSCSSSCDYGTKQRKRLCDGNNGRCRGSRTQKIRCKIMSCKADIDSSSCKEILVLPHGNVKKHISNTGKIKLSFQCSSGFVLLGPIEIACKRDGNWSNPAPFCIATNCPKSSTPVEFGRNCHKSCSSWWHCSGISANCLCDDDCGRTCFNPESVICNKPTAPKNGNVQYESRGYGHVVQYSCNQGYSLGGSQRRRCRSDGKWSGLPPKCTESKSKNREDLGVQKCGQAGNVGNIFNERSRGSRVLAGTNANTGAWPWQAMITANMKNDVKESLVHLKGGGSILNDKWILTAAHIFDRVILKRLTDAKDYLLLVGVTSLRDINKITEHGRLYEPGLLQIHPEYDRYTKDFDYDVALVKVGKPYKVVNGKLVFDSSAPVGKITFSLYIKPVCLPCLKSAADVSIPDTFKSMHCATASESSVRSEFAVVTGFGKIDTKSSFFSRPGVLQQGKLRIADDQKCNQSAKEIRNMLKGARFTPRMICTVSGRNDAVVDACQGDSGGPLVRKIATAQGTEFWVQEGIVSWGYGCATIDVNGNEYPGYFINVSSIISFIQESLESDDT